MFLQVANTRNDLTTAFPRKCRLQQTCTDKLLIMSRKLSQFGLNGVCFHCLWIAKVVILESVFSTIFGFLDIWFGRLAVKFPGLSVNPWLSAFVWRWRGRGGVLIMGGRRPTASKYLVLPQFNQFLAGKLPSHSLAFVPWRFDTYY